MYQVRNNRRLARQLLDWGQSCSKLSADALRPNDTRRDRTIQDSASTFQQALYACFFLKQIIVRISETRRCLLRISARSVEFSCKRPLRLTEMCQ